MWGGRGRRIVVLLKDFDFCSILSKNLFRCDSNMITS
jgi:hypothetical protein